MGVGFRERDHGERVAEERRSLLHEATPVRALGEHPEAALAFGRDLIGKLLRAGFQAEARKVFLRCQRLDERFLPRPEDQIPLAAIDSNVTQR